jgi:hypothetical protein
MRTQFITLTIALPALPDLQPLILNQLQTHGEPLRWSIAALSGNQATIEAVVLTA